MSMIQAKIHVTSACGSTYLAVEYGIGASRVPVNYRRIEKIVEAKFQEIEINNLTRELVKAMPDIEITVYYASNNDIPPPPPLVRS